MNWFLYLLISSTAFFFTAGKFFGLFISSGGTNGVFDRLPGGFFELFEVKFWRTWLKGSVWLYSYVYHKYIWNSITIKTEHFANIDIFSFILVRYCFRQCHFWFCSLLLNTEIHSSLGMSKISKYSGFLQIRTRIVAVFGEIPYFLGKSCFREFKSPVKEMKKSRFQN